MPSVNIDLSTRILDDDMSVQLIHPGARYAFFDDVLNGGVLPVDVPYLQVADGRNLPAADDIAPMLERARLLRKWAKRPLSEANTIRPSLDIDQYRVGLNMDPAAQGVRTRLRNAANDILWGLPEGTLAVIPSRRLGGNAILAEFGSPTEPRQIVNGTGHYFSLQFSARPMVNIKSIPMTSLPGEVLKNARSTSVVNEVGGYAEDEVLRLYYGDYMRKHEYVVGVVAETDDFDALVMGQMIDLHIALDHFIRTGVVLAPGRGLYDRNVMETPNLHAAINSPDGRASLESSGIATFCVKLLMILAASGVLVHGGGPLIAQGALEVANSAQQDVEPALLEASANALTGFFATAGIPVYSEYIEALQNGLERNQTTPTGTATIQP
ncbi:MAG: hypothetical protein ACI9KK_002768 [Ascidiaceihabitans sp.]|jgi:hypothetical protein